MSAVQRFIDDLAAVELKDAFNPYSHICPVHDKVNAAAVRRRNLEEVLRAAIEQQVTSIWIGRDLGYRGGRRTGLALTDERHLQRHASLYSLKTIDRATVGEPLVERTASVVWEMVDKIGTPVFFWNVFPFHPHEPNDPMTNRCHTRREREVCRRFLVWLLETLRPKNVVAIGNDAFSALQELGVLATKIRHPSYGGQTEFCESVSSLYGLTKSRRRERSQQMRLT